jgi:hypothetical protein
VIKRLREQRYLDGADFGTIDHATRSLRPAGASEEFQFPALDGLLHAIRKSNLKRFQTKSQDVCRIEDGNTNTYLKEERAIEEFLKDVEPRYNASVRKLHEN